MDEKILIIEDDIAEAIYAQADAARAGYRLWAVATNLAEGLDRMADADLVLSDLFFPSGQDSVDAHVQRFLPFYERHKERRFALDSGAQIVLRAVEACAELFGMTPTQYVEEFMSKVETPQSTLKAAREAVRGVKDPEQYERFLEIERGIRQGTQLPLGIVAQERARELGKPIVIVTSTYHHDDAFEAVRHLVTVPYKDTLVEGRKDWAGGIELLTKR
ncbi:MAG: hypothetical protein H6502_03005 [Candidatus Woesearchaeota archaeon]|nr:MAG: hypothetical protein H6502_03005 [Candidatus Woesearchaeota archaeon]